MCGYGKTSQPARLSLALFLAAALGRRFAKMAASIAFDTAFDRARSGRFADLCDGSG